MTVTVTGAVSSASAVLAVGASFGFTRQSRNIVHTILGSDELAVSSRPSDPRKGTIVYLCEDAAQALALEDLHAAGGFLTATDGEQLDMVYVVDGRTETALDPDTRVRWTVAVDFQQVVP